MTDANDVLKPSYVVFTRCLIGEAEEILFFGEFKELADAEELKADKNRTMPATLSEFTVSVGVANFVPHEDDYNQDYVEITPRDGSEKFKWSDMIDGNEVAKLKLSSE